MLEVSYPLSHESRAIINEETEFGGGVCRSDAHLLPRETEFSFTAVPVSQPHQSSGEPPYLTLNPLLFFLLSPSLLNGRSSTGQSTTQLPENQLEGRLWWWIFKGQRAGRVSPRLS